MSIEGNSAQVHKVFFRLHVTNRFIIDPNLRFEHEKNPSCDDGNRHFKSISFSLVYIAPDTHQ